CGRRWYNKRAARPSIRHAGCRSRGERRRRRRCASPPSSRADPRAEAPLRTRQGLLRRTSSLREQLVQREADVVGVAAVLTQRTEGGRGRGDVELTGTEVVQGAGPVEGFRYAGGLEEVALAAQVRDGVRELFGQFRGHLGQAAANDR